MTRISNTSACPFAASAPMSRTAHLCSSRSEASNGLTEAKRCCVCRRHDDWYSRSLHFSLKRCRSVSTTSMKPAIDVSSSTVSASEAPSSGAKSARGSNGLRQKNMARAQVTLVHDRIPSRFDPFDVVPTQDWTGERDLIGGTVVVDGSGSEKSHRTHPWLRRSPETSWIRLGFVATDYRVEGAKKVNKLLLSMTPVARK